MSEVLKVKFTETGCLAIDQYFDKQDFSKIVFQETYHEGDELEITIKKVGEKDVK